MAKISKATLVRCIVIVILFANQILVAFGHSPLPFSDDQITAGVSTALTVLGGIWGAWFNNSFTKKAIQADHYKKSSPKK